MMKVIKYPKRETWQNLCQRAQIERKTLTSSVANILETVKLKGDRALLDFTEKFDGVALDSLVVQPEEITEAKTKVSTELKEAIVLAKNNIERFHKTQQFNEKKVETIEGVVCWRKSVAIEKVGLYIPGGSAPLFSTILMLAIPARIAGCKEIVLCTPPNAAGSIAPEILFTADLVGVTKIVKVGGAQAIAAMAYGTTSVPRVYKILGPGNQYVTKAKELVQIDGVAIDMPAGPSEVLVLADETAVPEFVAADLLSQAEHGPDSQVILVGTTAAILEKTLRELEKQLAALPRKTIASKALDNSRAILVESLTEGIAFSNEYAPEHLILASENASTVMDAIVNAGSVFLGNYSCESAGDYASGTNHTLPTNGFAKNFSGVSLDSFVKKITFQQLTKKGIQNIGPAIELMAAAEGLDAHKNAVTLRLNQVENV
jgi:histidinol dehydrogenase